MLSLHSAKIASNRDEFGGASVEQPQRLRPWSSSTTPPIMERGGSAESLRLASRALEIDPRCVFAATLAGECHLRNVRQGWADDPKSEIAEGFRLLRLALSIDGNDPAYSAA